RGSRAAGGPRRSARGGPRARDRGGRRPRHGADRRAGGDPPGLSHLAVAPDPRQGRRHPRRPPGAASSRRPGPAGPPGRPSRTVRPNQPASDGPLTDRADGPVTDKDHGGIYEAPPRRTAVPVRFRAGPPPAPLRRL